MGATLQSATVGLLLAASAVAGCTSPESSESSESSQSSVPEATMVGEPSGCASDEAVERFLADWRSREPTDAIGVGATIEEALCAQRKIVERLQPTLGEPVGYKAALTNPGARERFGVDEPVRGILLERMLLDDGASVPADFGARPQYEADLLVVVDDPGINEAETPEEVLAHLSEVVPFIELPDLAVTTDQPIDGSILTAINVAARLGVLGEPVPVERTPEFLRALSRMTVRMVDQDGQELESPRGSAVLGHPLNSVPWLVDDGVRLERGDLVSVGSVGSLYPAEAGETITVTYEGLPGNPSVSVRFE